MRSVQRRQARLVLLALAAIVAVVVFLATRPSPQPHTAPEATPAPTGSGSLFAVHVIDVGQGDSILVEFPTGERMLVDAGDRAHGDDVVAYLRSRGVSRIDTLVATHPHADHIGGMPAVLEAFPVTRLWDSGLNTGSPVYERVLSLAKSRGARYVAPRAGLHERVGDVAVEVLAPVAVRPSMHDAANNSSIVIRLVYGAVSVLLTGDMEEEERESVGRWPHATVLKVAHHGSVNGTDARFLNQVRPEVAVISFATGNEYGHPHAETMQALRNARAMIFTTAANGTVVVTSDGATYTVTPHSGSPVTRTPGQRDAS